MWRYRSKWTSVFRWFPLIEMRTGLLRRLALLLALGLIAFVVIGYVGARQSPRVVNYTVELENWPAGQPPLRIVQLSDIHGSWLDMPPSRIATIVDQANALRPDLIVLTGDYCCGKKHDGPSLRMPQIAAPLAGLHAPMGVFAVLGNHDSRRHVGPAFASAGIDLLINRWVDIGPVVLAGINDWSHFPNWRVGIRDLSATLPTGKPVVLLAHEPDYFQNMPVNIDLLIVGHTHGGQIMLPLIGTHSLGSYLDAHLRGKFVEHGQTMIVSSGLGTSVLPLRIGVRPEIVVITVQASGRKSGTDK
jgi:uncharacterized protein